MRSANKILKVINIFIITIYIIITFFGCTNIGVQQALVTRLTVECEKGVQISCDKIEKQKLKLKKMIGE